jgi:nucleoside-diphosphate-sugar epimerase
MKRVVITGGAGFVGEHLIPHLLARGAEQITVLDRSPVRPEGTMVSSVLVDLADGIPWSPDERVDVVYHLAAAATSLLRRGSTFATTSTPRFVWWVPDRHGGNIVFSSTMMVYGARGASRDSRLVGHGLRAVELEAERVLVGWQAAAPGPPAAGDQAPSSSDGSATTSRSFIAPYGGMRSRTSAATRP